MNYLIINYLHYLDIYYFLYLFFLMYPFLSLKEVINLNYYFLFSLFLFYQDIYFFLLQLHSLFSLVLNIYLNQKEHYSDYNYIIHLSISHSENNKKFLLTKNCFLIFLLFFEIVVNIKDHN